MDAIDGPEDAPSDSEVFIIDNLPLPAKLEQDLKSLETFFTEYLHRTYAELKSPSTLDLLMDVADQLRDIRFRGSIGSQTAIIPKALKAINRTNSFIFQIEPFERYFGLQLILQSLRILGNLVHTCNANRQRCLDAGGASTLKSTIDLFLKLLKPDPQHYGDQIQIALIVATNLCLDYPPAQAALSETGLIVSVSEILECARQNRLKWMSFPLVLLEELCSSEADWDKVPESLPCTLVQMMLHLLGSVDEEEYEDPSREGTNAQAALLCSNALLSVVEHARMHRFTTWLLVTVDPPMFSFAADERPPVWIRLLMFLRFAGDIKSDSAIPSPTDDSPNLLSVIKANVIRSIVLAVAFIKFSPHTRTLMFNMLVDWIEEKQVLEDRVDLVIMIGLWLGNLACDEESCRTLVEEYKILDTLTVLFQSWSPSRLQLKSDPSSNKVRPGQQVQVLHAWCGLARNLAVGDLYKTKLGEIGLVEYALECLRPEFDIVELLNGTAAALLRHLCKNHPDNVKRTLSSDRMDSVIKLARKSDQPFLVLESSRLLCTLVNTANRLQQSSDFSGVSDQLKALENGMAALYSETTVEVLVQFAYIAVSSYHPVLINEALVSLTLLAGRSKLAHSICKNLVKAQNASSPESEAAEAGDPTSRGLQDGGKPHGTCLEALLSFWIPPNQPAEEEQQETNGDAPEKVLPSKNTQAPTKATSPTENIRLTNGDRDEATVDQPGDGDKGAKQSVNNEEVDTLAKLLKESTAERPSRKIPQLPFEMKKNLEILLSLLGDQAVKKKDSDLLEDVTEEGNASHFKSDLTKIQHILLHHYKSYHHSPNLSNPSLAGCRTQDGSVAGVGSLDQDRSPLTPARTIPSSEPSLTDVLRAWKVDLNTCGS